MIEISRRRFVAGAAGLAVLGGRSIPWARAAVPSANLAVGTRTIEVNGRAASVFGLGFGDKRPLARFNKGETFAVAVENRLSEPTLIHWHGLTPPSAEDGTPGLSQPPIGPGARYSYAFPLTRAGTFWMHSHVGLQRQRLLDAPLIVADPEDAHRDEQEIVVLLNDFTFRDPAEILARLTRGGTMAGMEGMHDSHAMTHDMMHGMAQGGMAGMAMDVNDVDFDAYLANERTLGDPETVRVAPGARLRLRLINGAAATNFWIDLGALQGELIAVDGDPVLPLNATRFPIAMAQRLDIRLALPKAQGAWPILALREGARERTGIVLATAGATVRKLATTAEKTAAQLGAGFEQRLRAARPLPPRKSDRTIRVDLTGGMMAYDWGFNGLSHGEAKPISVRAGERVEITLRNRTMMTHPIHLHGHHFQVVAIDRTRFAGALRDTVLVPAMGSVAITFDAKNPGKWAFHCHNLYHMAAGMMTSVEYAA